MAQILKEESRLAIIEAAKEEFLEKGYKDASMRTIAKKANMTVGNLYRYFDNKEDIIYQIVGPTLNKINDVVKEMTQNTISLETRVFSVKYDAQQLRKMFDSLAEQMVDIYFENKTEFNILLLHSKINDDITDWFTKLVNDVISSSYRIDIYHHEVYLLSRAYAISIFDGLRELFKNADIDSKTLKQLCIIYFRTYVYMLDADVKNFLG